MTTAVAGGLPRAGAAKRQATYVSGRLSIAGYTIAVVGYNGKNVVSSKQSFRLLARDTRVTLQLINPRGHYAGPVLVGGSTRKAVIGFKAPANVGTIIIVPSKGYGHLAHNLAAKYLDRNSEAPFRLPLCPIPPTLTGVRELPEPGTIVAPVQLFRPSRRGGHACLPRDGARLSGRSLTLPSGLFCTQTLSTGGAHSCATDFIDASPSAA